MSASTPPYDTLVLPYSDAAIAQAAALIRAGFPVAVPTETVYGLAADATNGEAVARVYEAKGRPSFNPLIVHVLDLAAAERIGMFDDAARALAIKHWPGPLTLVVPARPGSGIAALATAGLSTIAIRVPAHRAMRALLASADVPLAAPSANASGRISPTRAEHVLRTLDGQIAMVIDDGATQIGLESTIMGIEGGDVTVLRPGIIGIAGVTPSNGEVRSPGQLAKHYAPAKPLRLNATRPDDGEWMIGFGKVVGDSSLSPTGDLAEAAANLFARLHEADISSQTAIAIAPVPRDGIGAALNDRLQRASFSR